MANKTILSMILVSFTTIALSHPHHHHYSYDPPPPQDQCKSVNASEPLECPRHIGPPCPPCYTNYRPNYEQGDSLNYTSSMKQSISNFMQWYIDYFITNYPPNGKFSGGYDLYTGTGGRIQIFLRQYIYTKNTTYLQLANEYATTTINQLPSQITNGAYLVGHNGVWLLSSIVAHFMGNTTAQNQYISNINDTYNSVNKAIINGENESDDGIDLTNCVLDEGLAGMLYVGTLLNKFYDKEIINPEILANITFYILDFGIKTGNKLGHSYLLYECPYLSGCYIYGAGYGQSGILHAIYTVYNRYPQQLAEIWTNPTYYNAIKNTLDFFISIQLSDGNMPTATNGTCYQEYGDDNDARVQWCHGAPGFINLFGESVLLFSKYNETAAEMYLDMALSLANVTWDRGLLVKGTMYCHGIGGNINMLWYLGHIIKHLQEKGSSEFLQRLKDDGYDLEYLKNESVWRAKQFVIWTLNWDNVNQTRIYDSNEGQSMYAGNFAISMTYIQMLQDGWPFEESVCQPGYNLCI